MNLSSTNGLTKMRRKLDPNERPRLEPHLGIFWCVPNGGGFILLIDKVPLAEAEVYGDCLTHPRGHYEVWESWRRLGTRQRARRKPPSAVMIHEYEHFPRGRIVADGAGQCFTILADRKLHRPPFPAMIVDAFGLDPAFCILRADAHYRTGPNGF